MPMPPKACLHRLSALLCLLVYLGSATSLIPGAAAVLAWMGGEHQVSFSVRSGGVRVVLHHDEGRPGYYRSHTHGLLSHTVILLAEPGIPGEADHVLNFADGGAVGREQLRSVVGAAADLQDAPSRMVVWQLPAPPPWAPATRPAPVEATASIGVLRSTILRI